VTQRLVMRTGREVVTGADVEQEASEGAVGGESHLQVTGAGVVVLVGVENKPA